MSLVSVLNCRGVVNRFSANLVANVVLVSSARRFKNNSLLLKQQGYLYYIMFTYAYNIMLISTTLQKLFIRLFTKAVGHEDLKLNIFKYEGTLRFNSGLLLEKPKMKNSFQDETSKYFSP